MYKRILLAFDGSVEGRGALREGALMAKACQAQVFLLSVVAETPGMRIGEGAYPAAPAYGQDSYREVLAEGLTRLGEMGLQATAELMIGEPAQVIGAYARQVQADLVVVGHRKQSLLARWWAGPTGSYLVDHVPCSVLIARNAISDEVFTAACRGAAEPAV